MAVNRALIDALRVAFVAHVDGAQAGPMQAYMKSALPFFGIAAPLRRQLQGAAVKAHPCADAATLALTVATLWDEATHREERYAAAELARMAPHGRLLDLSLLPMIERMIVEANRMWLRRAAMLTQRRLKTDFDPVLLYDCILPSIGNGAFADEFFIRKGIGWALRERSYRAPDEVQAFCREYAGQLAPLTVREALKALRRRSAS